MQWILVEERLPENGVRVLIYTPNTNLYGPANAPVHVFAMRLCKGKTLKEVVAQSVICTGDEWGNNRRPYCWLCENGGHAWGQDVSHWMPLPEPPDDKKDWEQRLHGGCGGWDD